MKVSGDAALKVSQAMSYAKKGEISVGDIFTGRVLSVEDGLLFLLLADGSKISARVMTDANYSEGDVLKLEVIEETQGQLIVRQTDNKGEIFQSQNNIGMNPADLLKLFGSPDNNRYMQAAKAILEMGTEPSPEILEKAARLLSEKQVDDPKQAVFLAYNKMENRHDYFPVLRQIVGGVFNFQDEWLSLTDNIGQLDEETVVKIARNFLFDAAINDTDVSKAGEKIAELLLSYGETAQIPGNELRQMVDSFLYNTFAGLFKQQGKLNLPEHQHYMEASEDFPDKIDIAEIADVAGSKLFSVTDNSETFFIHLINRHFSDLTPDKSFTDEIIRVLSKLYIQFKDKIPENLTGNEAKSIITTKMKAFFNNASDVQLPKLNEWMKDTVKKLSAIKEAATGSDSSTREVLQPRIHELETALKFFNDIISYEAYAQIPLLLKDNAAKGEIYIMKRKNKNRKISSDDFSVFLSITTFNIGVLDTFINVRDKRVMLRLMAEDDKYISILQNEYKYLYEALSLKGFQLYEIKYSLRGEKLNPVNAERIALDITNAQNQRVDMRI